jgi:protein-tyrosine phosphatase
MEKKLVLFVCTGNTCRSPLAAALFNKYAAERNLPYYAESAGVSVPYPSPASEYTVFAGKEYGVDLTNHISRQVTSDTIEKAAHIVCMEPRHKSILENFAGAAPEKTVLLSACGLPDPYGMGETVYRQMAAEMDLAVRAIVERLAEEESR